MKSLITIFAFLGVVGIGLAAHAEETVGEKAAVVGKDVKRAVKKGANRVEEGLCGKLTGDSKVSCLAKEMKNRAVETKDTVVDKATEVKNNVDSDKK